MNIPNAEADSLGVARDLSTNTGKRRGAAGKVASPTAISPHNIKVQISIKLDADVLEHFKAQAKLPGAVSYQIQINQALRDVMNQQQTEQPNKEF